MLTPSFISSHIEHPSPTEGTPLSLLSGHNSGDKEEGYLKVAGGSEFASVQKLGTNTELEQLCETRLLSNSYW